METLIPERIETGGNSYKRLGLTVDQIAQLTPVILDEIRRSPTDSCLPKAFYFRQQRANGTWLIRGLGLHFNQHDFLLHDFPHLDDPYAFYTQMETVYLPLPCSPPAAKDLLNQTLDDRQPKLQPLLDLPTPLKRPTDPDRPRYQELAVALTTSLEHTRAKLTALGCCPPTQPPAAEKTKLPDPEKTLALIHSWLDSENQAQNQAEASLFDLDFPAGLAVDFLDTDEQIHEVSEIAAAVNVGQNQPLDLGQIHSLLAKLSKRGSIQRVSQGYYASRSLDLTGFKPHQLPGPTPSRIVSLLEVNVNREWAGENVAAGLNQAGSLFSTKAVEPLQAQSCLQYLERQGKIRRTDHGLYAALDCPKPAYSTSPDQPELAYQPRPGSIVDRILTVINGQPNRRWTPLEIRQAANTGVGPTRPPLRLSQVHSGLVRLANRSQQIQSIGRGYYASLKYDPTGRQPSPPVTERLTAMLEAQNRDFNAGEAKKLLAQDGGPPASQNYVGKCLRRLVSRGQARLTEDGRYARPERNPIRSSKSSEKSTLTKPKPTPKPPRYRTYNPEADPYPIPPPPPKSDLRDSLGRRVGRLVRSWPEPSTPDEIADALEDDSRGPFNRAAAEELAESALRRHGKLAN